MFNYSLLVPIFGIIGGVSIAIIAIITQFKIKRKMVEQGMEIPLKKPTPYGGLKSGALFIGAAIGLLLGGLMDNLTVFEEPEVGYFAGIFLFGGLGLLLSSWYIQREVKKENQ